MGFCTHTKNESRKSNNQRKVGKRTTASSTIILRTSNTTVHTSTEIFNPFGRAQENDFVHIKLYLKMAVFYRKMRICT